jgi:two-component system, chemotaxis family, response regulator Rcp1
MKRADRSRPEQRVTGDTAVYGKRANLFAGTAFLAAMTLLILLGLLGYRTIVELRGATDWVTHTYQVIGKLQVLLTDLSEAESGQRGFIITGDERYLGPYNAALGEVDKDLAAVKSLTEDNPGQQKRVAEIEAAVGERKGEFAAAPRPDLILLDLGLPKKGGLEVLAEIKADPGLRRIPVIVLTTSRAETDVLKSYDLHANSFITKPVHLSEFFELVRGIEHFWFSIVKLPPR